MHENRPHLAVLTHHGTDVGSSLSGGFHSPAILKIISGSSSTLSGRALSLPTSRFPSVAPRFFFFLLSLFRQAVAEVKVGKDTPVLDAAGKAGFFLWRSTYVVKQASFFLSSLLLRLASADAGNSGLMGLNT